MSDIRSAPLHLLLGDCGAGILGRAAGEYGLTGDVHVIPDDLGHGPLEDGAKRLAYMRRCYDGFDEWRHGTADPFDGWRGLVAQVTSSPREVVVWRGRNVSESVLLAMACHRLAGVAMPMSVVDLPDGRHVGTFQADEVAALAVQARPLDDQQRQVQAAMFERLRDEGTLRRRWRDGRVVGVPIEDFDGLLVASTRMEWQPALDVVVAAMRAADPRDGLSDLFLSSRLKELISQGVIEAERPAARLQDYAVRRGEAQ